MKIWSLILTTLLIYFGSVVTSYSIASPWIEVQDKGMRQALQVLADAGLIRSSTITFPIDWRAVAVDLHAIDRNTLSPQCKAALARVLASFNYAQDSYYGGRISGSSDVPPTEQFAQPHRSKGELSVVRTAQSNYFATRLSLNFRAAPVSANEIEVQSMSLEGSYLAMRSGKTVFSLEQTELWWSPSFSLNGLGTQSISPLQKLRISYSDEVNEISWRLQAFAGYSEDELRTADGQLEHETAHGVHFSFRDPFNVEYGLGLTESKIDDKVKQLTGSVRAPLSETWGAYVQWEHRTRGLSKASENRKLFGIDYSSYYKRYLWKAYTEYVSADADSYGSVGIQAFQADGLGYDIRFTLGDKRAVTIEHFRPFASGLLSTYIHSWNERPGYSENTWAIGFSWEVRWQ